MDVFDDGPMKPVRIWSRIGRQPILAGGNSNGDIPMLQYAAAPAMPGCACWSCTTTPTASSATPPERRSPWSGPAARTGPSSA